MNPGLPNRGDRHAADPGDDPDLALAQARTPAPGVLMGRLFPVRGGVHPDYRKELTSEKAIVAMAMPSLLYLPLQQHVGAPAQLRVAPGERVRKGQMLARCDGTISAPQHAPTSGLIREVAEITAPHPSGLAQTT